MKKKEIGILLVCLFLVMIGYGLTLPILPFLVEQSAKSNGFLNFSPALHVGLMTGIFPLMQFLTAPLWGRLSDRIGRRPVLAAGMMGYALSLILFGWTIDLMFLYILRIVGGIFSASVLPTVNSWVTDLSDSNYRGKALAWTGGAASLGVIFGPVLSSFFLGIDWFSEWSWKLLTANPYTVAFMIAGFMAIFAFATVLLWLPNKRMTMRYEVHKETKIADWALTKAKMIPFLLYALVIQGALSMFESTFALHAQQTLGYSVLEMGYIFMACGLGMSLSQIGLTGPLLDRWGEKRILLIGFLFVGLSLFLLMLVDTFTMIILLVSYMALGIALVTPTLASLTSKISTNNNIGKCMGLLASYSSLGLTIGSFLGAGLYSVNIHLPYLVFTIIVFTVPIHMIKSFE
ncbi:MFS transporter [Fodinibius sp.]|uniref:MFS transporter n=1 Tax=Fodinibius sp. TaxID=1872440 RepID=UPI002ACE6E1D|nr:MFS transporter [Fodinibius sp.]MDZ7660498.1 MFS transporter [Fodinibius sp.]